MNAAGAPGCSPDRSSPAGRTGPTAAALALVGVLATGGVARSEPPAEPDLAEPASGVASASGAAEDEPASGDARILLPALEVPAINLSIWALARFVLRADYAYISADSVIANLRGPWTLDVDSFEVNQFGHPYQGALSFTAARSAGLGFWSSLLFPVAGSLMWELAMETDPPSINDQVTTPFAGALLGETLHRLAGLMLHSGGGETTLGNEVLAAVVNPMQAINRHLFEVGLSPERPPPFAGRYVAGATLFGGIREQSPDGEPVIVRTGQIVTLGVRLTHGVPGAGLVLRRPLDHFDLDAELNLAARPFGLLSVRGLLWGRTWRAGPLCGLGGVVAMYDFFNAKPFRVSSSAVGLGTTHVLRFGDRSRLLLSLADGLVVLGAAGLSESDEVDRDYHVGPGNLAQASAGLLLGDRFQVEAAVRHHFLAGRRVQRGYESILLLDLRAEARLFGCHGVGLRVTRGKRVAGFGEASVEPVDQQGMLLRAYWAYFFGGPGDLPCDAR